MKKKCYEAPDMEVVRVELEKGFMKASIFEPEDKHDEGVTIQNHEFGESGNFTDDGWD